MTHMCIDATTRAAFDLKLPAYLFTQSNLRNPRPWSAR